MEWALAERIKAMGLIRELELYKNHRHLNGTGKGRADIVGWCTVVVAFEGITMVLCFEIVVNLGICAMLGNQCLNKLSVMIDLSEDSRKAFLRNPFVTYPWNRRTVSGLPVMQVQLNNPEEVAQPIFLGSLYATIGTLEGRNIHDDFSNNNFVWIEEFGADAQIKQYAGWSQVE
jgi:hypothetical protein